MPKVVDAEERPRQERQREQRVDDHECEEVHRDGERERGLERDCAEQHERAARAVADDVERGAEPCLACGRAGEDAVADVADPVGGDRGQKNAPRRTRDSLDGQRCTGEGPCDRQDVRRSREAGRRGARAPRRTAAATGIGNTTCATREGRGEGDRRHAPTLDPTSSSRYRARMELRSGLTLICVSV